MPIEPKKILILGASGMLGHKLLLGFGADSRFRAAATLRAPPAPEFRQLFPGTVRFLSGLDAGDPGGLGPILDEAAPDVVINCIGIVKQNEQAKDYVKSIQVNSLFPHILARECERRGARLIHVSTDCVFDGMAGTPYTEQSPSNATDLYGRSKFLGEVIDRPHTLTLRTSIIGREIAHPTGLLEWFLSQKTGATVRGFGGALYSGLTTNLAIELFMRVITDHPELHGLYQVAAEPISKYRLLQIVNEIYNLNVHIDKDEKFFCDRRLDGARFEEATGWKAPAWPALVQAMRDQDMTHYKR